MSVDVEQLSAEPEPSIVIFEDTFDTDQEVRNMIDNSLKQFFMSSTMNDQTVKEKTSIAMRSAIQLVAENIARHSSGGQSKTVLIRKEYLREAAQSVMSNAYATPTGPFELQHEWESIVAKFLKLQSELKTVSRREVIFKTCERFKIDLRDFQVAFPKASLDSIV